MGGRDLVEMKCADPRDAPATCHNTQHTQFGIPPIPLHGCVPRLVIAHVWPRNCQPPRLELCTSSALRLAWGFGDSSLWSAKSVAIHCDVGSVICTFVVVVSHIRCTTPFAERTNNQVLLPLLLLAAALSVLFFSSMIVLTHQSVTYDKVFG